MPALSAPATQFRNVTQLGSLLPPWLWAVLRGLTLLATLALMALLLLRPGLGLTLLWGLAVPLLPLVFLVAPGVWRNVCPLSASNQAPRRLGLTLGLTRRDLSQGLAYPAGIVLLVAAVIGRKLLFDGSGAASALLIGAALLAALIGGVLFKGKSGWCSSICPLLPVQRLLGQTPYVTVASTQCQPCVGCAKNCYDYAPGVATLADQYDADPSYRNFRRVFAQAFPGLVLGYFMVPDLATSLGLATPLVTAPVASVATGWSGQLLATWAGLGHSVTLVLDHLPAAASLAGEMLLYVAASMALFSLAEPLAGSTRNVMPVLCAALGLNLYYGLAAPMLVHTLGDLGLPLGVENQASWIGALRTAVAIATTLWVLRSVRAERAYLREQLRRAGDGTLAPVVMETVRLHRRVIDGGDSSLMQGDTLTTVPAGPSSGFTPDFDSTTTPVAFDPERLATPANDAIGHATASATSRKARQGEASPAAARSPAAATPAAASPVAAARDTAARITPMRRVRSAEPTGTTRTSSPARSTRDPQQGAAAANTLPAALGREVTRALPQPVHPTPHGGRAELRIHPEGRCVPLLPGKTLLDALEACGAPVPPGCRSGHCGADAVHVHEGGACLGVMSHDERVTLARLGHGADVRLACMARVRKAGPVAIELLAPQDAAVAQEVGRDARMVEADGNGSPTTADTHRPGDRIEPTLQPAAASASRSLVARTRVPWDRSIQRVVIIGNGIAGLSAAEALRAHHPLCEIHLIGRERQASYLRTAVTGLINQRSGMQGLALRSDAWYAEQRIHCWLNTRAAAIDTERRQVTLATSEVVDYDRLILAMGASAWVPPIDGFGVPGSFVLRSAGDAMAIRAFVQRYGARRAVVLGGGLLGVEAADALHQLGLSVQIFTPGEHLLEHQLDRDAAALVAAHLRRSGVKVGLQTGVQSAHRAGSDRLSRLRLNDGHVTEAELLLVCAGVRPDITLAQEAGIATERGVLVDHRMRCSAPGVFACGDLAQTNAPMTGLWSPAAEQGRVAALTALGLAARYDHQVPVVTVKLAGLSVRSAGQLRAQGPGQLELCHRPTEATLTERYTKVVIEVDLDGNEHVLGAIVVGDDPDGDDMLAAAATRAHSGTLGAALMQRPWQRQRSELLDPPQPGHAAGQTVIVRDIPARTSQRKATVARKVA